MGHYKDLLERLGGYGDPDACLGRAVCADCFGDAGLKAQVEVSAQYQHCDFCGVRSDETISADLSDIVEFINDRLDLYYTTAENALPYESAEGGYQGEWWDTYDLLTEVLGLELPRDDGRLFQAIHDSLGTRSWCHQAPFSLSPDERLWFSWEDLCRVLKHERRFFFRDIGATDPTKDRETIAPGKMLHELERLIRHRDLIVELPAGTRMFRARHQLPGSSLRTPADLGPPPHERAVQANRMSPPGIVMLYLSDDPETALRETAAEPATFAVAEFETLKAVSIVDLTRLPSPPSIFEINVESDDLLVREELGFLHSFTDDLAKPIARDDRIHVEYVPTQVVTEFLRVSARTNEGSPIMGLRYPSARHPGRTSLVLFADRDSVDGDHRTPWSSIEPWIRLLNVEERDVTADDIERWP